MATTITRIKGKVSNNNLPILTSSGLISGRVNVFEYYLEQNGYELGNEKKEALETFYNTISENGITDLIDSLYLFIGDENTKSAINIPFIGNTNLEISDDFDGIYTDNGEIIGLTHFPEMQNISLNDMADTDKSFTYSFSYNGILESDYIGAIGKPEQIVEFKSSNGAYVRGAIFNNNNGQNTDRPYISFKNATDSAMTLIGLNVNSYEEYTSSAKTMCNGYFLCGFGRENCEYFYTRNAFISNNSNSKWFSNYSGSDGTKMYALNESPKNLKFMATPARLIDTNGHTKDDFRITSMTFFNDIPSTSDAKKYIEALRTLNIALGKEI